MGSWPQPSETRVPTPPRGSSNLQKNKGRHVRKWEAYRNTTNTGFFLKSAVNKFACPRNSVFKAEHGLHMDSENTLFFCKTSEHPFIFNETWCSTAYRTPYYHAYTVTIAKAYYWKFRGLTSFTSDKHLVYLSYTLLGLKWTLWLTAVMKRNHIN